MNDPLIYSENALRRGESKFLEPVDDIEHRGDCNVNLGSRYQCNCAELDAADEACRADDKNKDLLERASD